MLTGSQRLLPFLDVFKSRLNSFFREGAAAKQELLDYVQMIPIPHHPFSFFAEQSKVFPELLI